MSTRIAQGGGQMRLEVSDLSHVGACRRAALGMAERWQFDETASGRVSLVATELATNLIRHAGGGELLIQPIEYDSEIQIELLSIDTGSGMIDVARCLQDGYSTAGTTGTGLGAVRRLSATFDVYSQSGVGSVVLSRVASTDASAPASLPSAPIRFGTLSIALRGEPECGDNWSIAQNNHRQSVLVIDGLGHGRLAAAAASAGTASFAKDPFAAPSEALRRLHESLLGTRGAAAACVALDQERGQARYAGVGNIAGVLAESGTQRGMVSHNGTLGLTLGRTQELDYGWSASTILILHSDGLSSRWSLAAYPELVAHHPAVIAAVLYRDQARGRDDATVVVVSRRQ
jgi:anti-sigma regulatory factor (Ser/Thr protein kinase)